MNRKGIRNHSFITGEAVRYKGTGRIGRVQVGTHWACGSAPYRGWRVIVLFPYNRHTGIGGKVDMFAIDLERIDWTRLDARERARVRRQLGRLPKDES